MKKSVKRHHGVNLGIKMELERSTISERGGDGNTTEGAIHSKEISPRNNVKGKIGLNNKNVSNEKINGELDTNNKKTVNTFSRARSRSKSPRGKSPDKKEPEKKGQPSNTKNSPLKGKKEQKSPKQSPSKKKLDNEQSSVPSKTKIPSDKSSGEKDNIKKAKKRKVSNETSAEINSVPGEGKSEPNAKKPKALSNNQNLDKSSEQVTATKPKRKYAKKAKKQEEPPETGTSTIVGPQTSKVGNMCAKTENKTFNLNCKDDILQNIESDEASIGCAASIVQNGELSSRELQSLPSQPINVPLKKLNKKLKKPKVELNLPHVKQNIHSTTFAVPVNDSSASQGGGELEDSDTVDYSVNNGGGNVIDNLVEKKVVKIDDIEITELSDLNSSRESGDENMLDNCIVEKPQALNSNVSSPSHSQETEGTDTLPNSTHNVVHGIETVVNGEKVWVCDQVGCKYRGKTRVLFRKHLNHHGIYHCAHCEFIGYRYPDLEIHMVANHPQRWGRKKCKKCTRYIPGDEFEMHEQSCEGIKIVTCEICGKEFKFESLAREHAKKMHKSHNCQICEFIGDTKQILSHHMSQVHPKRKLDKHRCKQCDNLFSTKKLLNEHVKFVHSTSPKAAASDSTLAPVHRSPISATNVGDEEAIKSSVHEKIAQPLFENTDVTNSETLIDSQNDRTGVTSFEAKMENLNAPGADREINTNSANHPQLSNAAAITPNANNHVETVNIMSGSYFDQSTNLSLMDIPTKAVSCESNRVNTDSHVYEGNITSLGEYSSISKEHERLLNSFQQSTATSIGKEQKLDANLQAVDPVAVFNTQVTNQPIQSQQQPHLAPNVAQERPYACTKCPKRFKDQKTLTGHQSVHSKELNFKCDVETCLLAFKTNRLLQFHKKTVHDVAPGVPMYPCEHPDCHLVFKKKGQLKKHEVVHTGERKYICEWENCGKAFRHNANLKIHHLLHTGEKPIKCGYCDFSCRQKSSLIHHMKTKHKDIGWPPPKKDQSEMSLQHLHSPDHAYISNPLLPVRQDIDKKEESESHDESRSDLDSSFEGENSGINQQLKLESMEQQQEHQYPVYPKMLSTPTKAMVKAMAPGFRLNTPGFEKMKPLSPITSGAPLFSTSYNNMPSAKADVYDFDDDDSDSNIPVTLTKKPEKVKSPGRPQPTPSHASSLELLQAMEPINLSSDHKPIPEDKAETYSFTPKKKRATPKKKKQQLSESDTSKSSNRSNHQLDSSTESSLNTTSLDTSMDQSMNHSNDQSRDHSNDQSRDQSEHQSLDQSMDQSQDQSQDKSSYHGMDHMLDESTEKLSNYTEDENKVALVDSGVRSQESSTGRCSDDIVEEHVSENVPMSVSSSAASSTLPQNEEVDMDSQEPVAVPSQPEPYSDHSAPPSPELQHSNDSTVDSDHQPPEAHQHQSSHDNDMYSETNERMHDSNVSDIPQDVEDLALQRSLPPVSPNDIDSPGKERDTSAHSFDLPHDIDPDEAAKLLAGHDSFHEDQKNTSIGSHEVPVIMSNTSQTSKDDYLPPTPPSHNNSIHHEHEQSQISDGQYNYPSYAQPHHHPEEFDQIHDMSSHEKDRVEPESYSDPSQRRPSSSYVPDFLPTSAGLGSSGLGPPSVSSSYSSPSYSVPSQSQSDLPPYGAPGSNLPQYPPLSSSVPYLSSPTSSAYPTTTSAGSGISSYPSITTTSYNTESHSSDRVPSVTDTRPESNSYKDTEATTVTSPSSYSSAAYAGSRDLFSHYFQDPNMPLSHIAAAAGQPQDPRALPGYPSQQSSLQALQRSSADFLQRASAGGLPGMNYPSVTESLARLSQTTTQQPWIGHEERSRPWPQASPIIMPPELESAASRNSFSSRPEYSSLDPASKRPESAFPGVGTPSLQAATDRYDAYMGSAGHFNPTTNYSKSLPPVVSAPTKQLEEAYRQSAAQHISDYRTLSQGPPTMTDMYRMGMNPPPLGLDKYYSYSRDAMYRSQHIGSAANPFMPQTSTTQMPYSDRDYAARNPYAQDSAYSKYLQPANLTQPIPGLNAAPGDYFQARPGTTPDPYDPYRRSVIHNMMTRFY